MKEMNLFNNVKDSIVPHSVEEVMLDFLKCLSGDFTPKFILKGCMALKLHLARKEYRETRDLDLTVFNVEDWEIMLASFCVLANNKNSLGYNFKLTKRRGFEKNPNSDSATIEYYDKNGNYLNTFKIDMNVRNDGNVYMVLNKNLNINLYNIYGILTDKLNVLISKKICRRVKDLIDVYNIAIIMDFNMQELLQWLSYKGINLAEIKTLSDCYILNTSNIEEIKYPYTMYKMKENKENFEEVYTTVYNFVYDIYSNYFELYDSNEWGWNHKERSWKK